MTPLVVEGNHRRVSKAPRDKHGIGRLKCKPEQILLMKAMQGSRALPNDSRDRDDTAWEEALALCSSGAAIAAIFLVVPTVSCVCSREGQGWVQPCSGHGQGMDAAAVVPEM